MNHLFETYQKLFPEEAFFLGATKDTLGEIVDNTFTRRYTSHLDFYEKFQFPRLSERLYKVANTLSASLFSETKLTREQENTLRALLCDDCIQDSTTLERDAMNYLCNVCTMYSKTSFENELTRIEKRLSGNLTDTIRLPVSFKEWQQNMYGLSVISTDQIESEIIKLETTPNDSSANPTVTASPGKVEQIFSLLATKLNVVPPPVVFSHVPAYMSSAVPIAAAYWFNRLSQPNQRYHVFVNTIENISLAQLLLIIVHETLGHILHFDVVSTYCMDSYKKLPYLSRFSLTEGIALLAEELSVSLFHDDVLAKSTLALFGLDDSYVSVLNNNLQHTYNKAMLRRLARYLFELYLYGEGNSPATAIERITNILPVHIENLSRDLRSYLFTPGYGSCYMGGYRVLKDRVDLNNQSDREKLGAFGFSFVDVY